MLPLYEVMMQAQQGEATDAMARQFGLDDDQVRRAWAALMPAFSAGLKRSTGNPQDIGNFIQTLATGQHVRYFENMMEAFTPRGMADGNTILSQVFGSKEVSRAVAQQAAQVTGIGQDILKDMLPVMAATLMGGMFQQSTAGNSGNPFADMLGQMMSQTAAGRPSAALPENPFGQMMEAMFAGAKRGDADTPVNPFAEMFETMTRMGFPGIPDTRDPAPEDNPNPYDKLFGDMFDAGIKVQKDYQDNMEAIFDDYMRRMRNEP